MDSLLAEVDEIALDRRLYEEIVEHAQRKLRGDHLPDETPEKKAFGVLGGRVEGRRIEATRVFPFRRNLRHDERHGAAVDAVVRQLAVPSKTPLDRRGWLAHPHEVFAAQREADAHGDVIFGSYHMHWVGWAHDPLRDTPTAVDTALAREQGIWMLILSMVDPERPILRAFFEGELDREARLVIGGAARVPAAEQSR